MTRVKRGVNAIKRRRSLLKATKGFRWGRKSKERMAHDALIHAWTHSYVGRKLKKRESRKLWQQRINAGARQHNLSYSKFIHLLLQKHILLDRKILSEIADKHPETFAKIVQNITS